MLHEIIYNAAKNKHVYNNYSLQIVPQFTFWDLKHNYTKVNKPLSVYFVQLMQSLRTMIQIKALRKMNMFRFKTQVRLRYPQALNRNK